jgi:hypothetical protein
MRLAEEFERCDKCGQGWFQEKEFVLIHKDSPKRFGEKPLIHRKEVQYHCAGCGHIQYKYTEEVDD